MIWKNLESKAALDEIDRLSQQKPVVLFKHSTRCSISSMALNRLERSWDHSEMQTIEAFYVDLIVFREVSNAIEEKYGVFHQSPQILVIENGKCSYDDSHMNISYDTLKEKLFNS